MLEAIRSFRLQSLALRDSYSKRTYSIGLSLDEEMTTFIKASSATLTSPMLPRSLMKIEGKP